MEKIPNITENLPKPESINLKEIESQIKELEGKIKAQKATLEAFKNSPETFERQSKGYQKLLEEKQNLEKDEAEINALFQIQELSELLKSLKNPDNDATNKFAIFNNARILVREIQEAGENYENSSLLESLYEKVAIASLYLDQQEQTINEDYKKVA